MKTNAIEVYIYKGCSFFDGESFGEKQIENHDTKLCATHSKMQRKAEDQAKKDAEKLALKLSKKREPRATISKDPEKWKNTFLCSSGKKVTQAEINRYRESAYNYQAQSTTVTKCHGCGQPATCRAHIIAQARCKQLNKTELIWHLGNFFPSCFKCNSAIESPKGQEWKTLKNIDACIQFIYEHDKELYFKFEANGWQAENSVLKQFTEIKQPI